MKSRYTQVVIEGMKNTDAYFIYGDDQCTYQVWFTNGLRKYIESP